MYLVDTNIWLGRLLGQDKSEIVEKFKIYFDDAYQYTAAQKFNFTVVSFDKDFDRTPSGRKTPQDIYQRKKKK
ncbi:MAG: hypothetical protein NT166_01810 [Candidatus Aminicenantes bacterium]|nr:hypothetical protein [Candidatus Aminicenantes bacterium]